MKYIKYNHPSDRIKLTLEAVMFLFKGEKLEWAQVKKEMYKEDFIKKILKFDWGKVKNSVID